MHPTQRVLELLSSAPDQPTIELHLQPDDVPDGFLMPLWVTPTTQQTIARALTARANVVDVIVHVPGWGAAHFDMPARTALTQP
jgi:hypothetical protein